MTEPCRRDDAPDPDDRAVTLERSLAREIRRPKPCTSDAAEVARCRSRITWVRSVGGLAGSGHTAGWSGTPVTGRTRTSGARVSGCASAAAKSPTSRSTRGLRSSTSQTSGASRSAGVTGAVRSSHASCINGVRGSMSVRSNTSASAAPAVAVARRNTPATCHGSVDHLAPRRAAARLCGSALAGRVDARGHALLLSPVASVSLAGPQMTASDEEQASRTTPASLSQFAQRSTGPDGSDGAAPGEGAPFSPADALVCPLTRGTRRPALRSRGDALQSGGRG